MITFIQSLQTITIPQRKSLNINCTINNNTRKAKYIRNNNLTVNSQFFKVIVKKTAIIENYAIQKVITLLGPHLCFFHY